MTIFIPGFPGFSGSSNHLAAAAGEFEPQRQSNWILTIENIEGSELVTLALEAHQAPSLSVGDGQVNFLNERRFIAGRFMPDTTPLVVKDMADIDVANVLYKWWTSVHNPVTGKIGLARNYKKRAALTLFAPEGSFGRVWVYDGIFPIAANFGNLSMSSEDVVMVELTLRYDRAIYAGSVTGTDGVLGAIQDVGSLLNSVGSALGAIGNVTQGISGALGSVGGLF